jgi:hypothetical protein
MVTIDMLADAALRREALDVRALAHELLRQHPRLCDVPAPTTRDRRKKAIAAALIELLAQRRDELPPSWTGEIGESPEPIYLLASADRMPRLRALCEADSPEPLRRRRLFAPSDYLTFA